MIRDLARKWFFQEDNMKYFYSNTEMVLWHALSRELDEKKSWKGSRKILRKIRMRSRSSNRAYVLRSSRV